MSEPSTMSFMSRFHFPPPCSTGSRGFRGNLHLPLPVRHAERPVGVLEPLVRSSSSARRNSPGRKTPPSRQFHQERKVGVLPRVLLEEGDLPVHVILLEDDVVHRHPERAVVSLRNRQPVVGDLVAML